jgi:hypothetical protein
LTAVDLDPVLGMRERDGEGLCFLVHYHGLVRYLEKGGKEGREGYGEGGIWVERI